MKNGINKSHGFKQNTINFFKNHFFQCLIPTLLYFYLQHAFYRLAASYGEFVSPYFASPELPFEKNIPVVSGFIVIYMLSIFTWFIMPIVLYIVAGKAVFYRTMFYGITLIVIVFIIYLIIPTKNTLDHKPEDYPYLNDKNFLDKLIFSAWNGDTPYCQMPSYHVLLTFVPAFALLIDNKKITHRKSGISLGIVFSIWAILVWISTFMVKQHYVLDGIVSFLLTIAIWYLFNFIKYERLNFYKICFNQLIKHQWLYIIFGVVALGLLLIIGFDYVPYLISFN